jgi:uncharacterized CHY-type Zn-finger protein
MRMYHTPPAPALARQTYSRLLARCAKRTISLVTCGPNVPGNNVSAWVFSQSSEHTINLSAERAPWYRTQRTVFTSASTMASSSAAAAAAVSAGNPGAGPKTVQPAPPPRWASAADAFRRSLPRINSAAGRSTGEQVTARDMRGWIEELSRDDDECIARSWNTLLDALLPEDVAGGGDRDICNFVLKAHVTQQVQLRGSAVAQQARFAVNADREKDLAFSTEADVGPGRRTFRDLFRVKWAKRAGGVDLLCSNDAPTPSCTRAAVKRRRAESSADSARPALAAPAVTVESSERAQAGLSSASNLAVDQNGRSLKRRNGKRLPRRTSDDGRVPAEGGDAEDPEGLATVVDSMGRTIGGDRARRARVEFKNGPVTPASAPSGAPVLPVVSVPVPPVPPIAPAPAPRVASGPSAVPTRAARGERTCEHHDSRYCWVKGTCCKRYHACIRCHDKNEDHPFDRRNKILVECNCCGAKDQPPLVLCDSCAGGLAEYNCPGCKQYRLDDDVDFSRSLSAEPERRCCLGT